jgi:hypothetical protein
MIKLEVHGKTIAYMLLQKRANNRQEIELDEKMDKLHKHYIDNPARQLNKIERGKKLIKIIKREEN